MILIRNYYRAGGAYEIDFNGYTIRIEATDFDTPKSGLGKYESGQYEDILTFNSYRSLEGGPNCIAVNANLEGMDSLSWNQVEKFEFYEVSPGKERTQISDDKIIINTY